MNGLPLKSDSYKYYMVNIKYIEERDKQVQLVWCNEMDQCVGALAAQNYGPEFHKGL